jgi:hypothetical protein
LILYRNCIYFAPSPETRSLVGRTILRNA